MEKAVRFGPGKWRVYRDRETGAWWMVPPYGDRRLLPSWRIDAALSAQSAN